MSKSKLALAGLLALGAVAPASAQRQDITNDLSRCASGPSVRVAVHGIKSSSGTVRVQIYRGTEAEWLKKGAWLKRIESRAQAGAMTFCLPLAAAGTYAVAVRHDVNGNGKTDLSSDGGGMSNNPSINIFNLGKPSYKKTAFTVGANTAAIRIDMKYM